MIIKVENLANDGATVYVYDVIDSYSQSSTFDLRLALAGAKNVLVRINSRGGNVIEGVAMYNLLREHDANRGEVHVVVDGLAGSIASLLMLAGRTRHMMPGAFVFTHPPTLPAGGNAEELAAAGKALEKIREEIAKIYQGRAGVSAEKAHELLTSDNLMNGPEALELGFATSVEKVLPESLAKNSCDFLLAAVASVAPTVPTEKRSTDPKPKGPEMDEKELIAKGVKQERERCQAHLARGGASPEAMAIAIKAINEGVDYGHPPTAAQYDLATSKASAIGARADAGKELAAPAAGAASDAGDLGDAVAAAMFPGKAVK